MSDAVQAVIEVVARLKGAVGDLFESYKQLPAVIEREHDAIRTGDFNLVEAIGKEKQALGDKIEASFGAVFGGSEQLGRWRARLVAGASAERPVSLTDCMQTLTAICAAFEAGDFAAQILRHQVDGLAKIVTEFNAKVRDVKPLIDANKHLLTNLSENYQESYRFWQEVAVEAASNYTQQGVQKPAGVHSAFVAKA
jgi:hypothetical protein